jgi:hypothetical protein
MFSQATQRSIFRWIHLVFGIPMVGFIYGLFEKLPDYARPTPCVFLPLRVVSGLWMWKITSFANLFRRDQPNQTPVRTAARMGEA